MFKSKQKLIFFTLIVIFGIFLISPYVAMAQSAASNMLWGGRDSAFQLTSGLGNEDPRIVAAAIIRILLGFLGLIALLLMLYGGWLWMSSAGDDSKVDKAKKVITSAIIGIIIILMSFAIATFVLNKLYQATGATGGGASCDASSYLNCNGCNRCDFIGGVYSWRPDLSCPGCTSGPGPGPINCDGDLSTPAVCDIGGTCPTNYFCDNATPVSSCTCQPLGGPGANCSATTTSCIPDDLRCMADLRCNNGLCICEGAPVIDFISPVDTSNIPFGAPGNLITIGGRFFGTTTGEIRFWDGSDFNVVAQPPSSVNINCTDYWTDNQVIVVVPGGAAVDGPVQVRRFDGQIDNTNNSRGPSIQNFDINSIVLPGICQLNPSTGPYGTSVTYHGINFQTGVTTANFGNPSSFVPAGTSNFSSNIIGNATVPSLQTGRTSTYASSTNGLSNSLYFDVTPSAATGPFIASFEPNSGPPKQYVTIRGSGFGNTRGSNRVLFGNVSTGIEANYIFPDECATSIWGDNQVVVKVPDTIPNNNYLITMVIGADTIDTASLTPNAFIVNNAAPLTPGLCKIFPTLAPNNSPVTLWGEYFGAHSITDSIVRFQLNHDQLGPLNAAGPIISWGTVGNVDKVEVVVHQLAASGPVRIVKAGPLESNGLNLSIGQCRNNAECGGAVCCVAGSFAAGRCVATTNDCYPPIPNSVFEWDFNTALATTSIATTTPPGPGLNSCLGYSISQCLASTFCPNSPGECSANTAATSRVIGTCNSNCDGIGGCNTSSYVCTYNSTLDKCTTPSLCSASAPVLTIASRNFTAYCADYSGSGHWHINTPTSCPNNWRRLPGNICVDNNGPACNYCPSGEVCSSGNCIIDREICAGQATCQTNQCILTEAPKCECCCRIGYSAQDCCAPLDCTGGCGNDPGGTTYGHCTGCGLVSGGQAAQDAACNCTGTTGKFCDTSTNADGICRDCTELGGNTGLCLLHSSPTTCCIDAKTTNQCRGNQNGELLAGGLCGYFDCQLPPTNNQCDSLNPIANGPYDDVPSCIFGCGSNSTGSGLGLSCAATSSGSYYAPTCNTGICSNPFGCLTYTGAPPTYPSDCGVCCCDPNDPLECTSLNRGGAQLTCKPNVTPCDGTSRGLCCGCTANTDCGNPQLVGCGSDTCCRARPSVASTTPSDNAVNVCRNALITATFDQFMDLAEFSGNVIVAGDYGQDACPAGTEYIALEGRKPIQKNIFVRAYIWLVDMVKIAFRVIWPSKFAQAYTNPSSGNNYCAVKGSASGYHTTADRTIMEFRPSKILDPDRLYYLIIRGDQSLATSTGVTSLWGIGMIDMANNGPNKTFNGINYDNSHIISFRTLEEQAQNSGVCQLDHVTVEPGSYLFQTNQNDANENDGDSTIRGFDTVADSDKVFVAFPRAANNQILNPVLGVYTWDWFWTPDNASVAAPVVPQPTPFPTSMPYKNLIRASNSITDGRTILRARAHITVDNVFTPTTANTDITGTANLYLFVCANPWPPVNISGLWSPWVDRNNNCTVNPTACVNTNYEMYYCRDAGSYGSYDDLPGIKSVPPPAPGAPVIMGNSPVTGLLKEAYYFREDVPGAVSALTPSNTGQGGTIQLNWPSVAGVNGYKLYWGRSSGNYTGYSEVGSGVTATSVSGLVDGQLYYFNITSVSAQNQESELFDEVSATPYDTTPPGIPTGVTGVSNATGTAEIEWNDVADANSYGIAYGTVSPTGPFGFFSNIGSDTSIRITDLVSGRTYYFAAVALDRAGNRATSSPGVSVLIR